MYQRICFCSTHHFSILGKSKQKHSFQTAVRHGNSVVRQTTYVTRSSQRMRNRREECAVDCQDLNAPIITVAHRQVASLVQCQATRLRDLARMPSRAAKLRQKLSVRTSKLETIQHHATHTNLNAVVHRVGYIDDAAVGAESGRVRRRVCPTRAPPRTRCQTLECGHSSSRRQTTSDVYRSRRFQPDGAIGPWHCRTRRTISSRIRRARAERYCVA